MTGMNHNKQKKPQWRLNLFGKVLWKSWGTNAGHFREQSRRKTTMAPPLLPLCSCAGCSVAWKDIATGLGDSGEQSSIMLLSSYYSSWRGVSPLSPSQYEPCHKKSGLKRPISLPWTSAHRKGMVFKAIFQLNTTGEATFTEMEITFRQKNKRTNGFLVLACIITCVLWLN